MSSKLLPLNRAKILFMKVSELMGGSIILLNGKEITLLKEKFNETIMLARESSPSVKRLMVSLRCHGIFLKN